MKKFLVVVAVWQFVVLGVFAAATPLEVGQNLDFWMKQLENPSPDIQINAIQRLAELKDGQSIPRLLASGKSSNPEVRYHASRALARIPDPQSLTGLEDLLRFEKDPYVKAEIKRSVRSLTEIFNKTKP